MAVSVRYLNRKLLKNVLHHVDTHNRLIEEKEMWTQKRKKPDTEQSSSDDDRHSRTSRRDRKSFGGMRSDNISDNRDIFKKKLADGKWNHSGFMELYPDEILDKQSMDEMSSNEDRSDDERKKRKKKRKQKGQESNSKTGGSNNNRIEDGEKNETRKGWHKTRGGDRREGKGDRERERSHRVDIRPTSPRKNKDSDKPTSPRKHKHSHKHRSVNGGERNNGHRTMERMDSDRGMAGHGGTDRTKSRRKHKHSKRTPRSPARHSDGNERLQNGKESRNRGQQMDSSVPPSKHRHRVSRPIKGESLGAKDIHYDDSESDAHLQVSLDRLGTYASIGGPVEEANIQNWQRKEPRLPQKDKNLISGGSTQVENGNPEVPGRTEEERFVGFGKENDGKDLVSQEIGKGEERSLEERFSDLEDEVFGLTQIKAKLKKRERELRRRLERKIGGKSRRHRHHKHKKRKKENSAG